MAKEKTLFSCTECGDSSLKWLGKCPGCGAWNTLVESSAPSAGGQNRYSQRVSLAPASAVATLADIEAQDVARTPTGQEELDRVLGGGLVAGGVVLIGGDPGIGKSTLLLQVVARLATKGSTIYISGEEAIDQVRLRARRLKVEGAQVALAAATSVRDILASLDGTDHKEIGRAHV